MMRGTQSTSPCATGIIDINKGKVHEQVHGHLYKISSDLHPLHNMLRETSTISNNCEQNRHFNSIITGTL